VAALQKSATTVALCLNLTLERWTHERHRNREEEEEEEL